MKMRSGLIVFFVLALVTAAVAGDADIRAEIQRRIGNITGVTVEVRDGGVTLDGTIPSLAQRINIEKMARRTVGVKAVNDSITVVPAERKSDQEITSALGKTLASNLNRDDSKAIRFSVQKNVVALTGFVLGSYTKQLAGALSSLVPGVVGVRNDIIVRPSQHRTDAEILADIKTRSQHNPMTPKQMEVSVKDGVVTLTGTVDSLVQTDQAEAVARFTPGVIDVKNLLFVKSGSLLQIDRLKG